MHLLVRFDCPVYNFHIWQILKEILSKGLEQQTQPWKNTANKKRDLLNLKQNLRGGAP